MAVHRLQFTAVAPASVCESLDILIHPLTDDMVDHHTVYALWLGTPIELKRHAMRRRGVADA